jgi:hypothetical protein
MPRLQKCSVDRQTIGGRNADHASAWSRHSQNALRHDRSKSMRIFAAPPIAATLAAAIGLSNLTPAKAKTLAGCKSDRAACARSCARIPKASSKGLAAIGAMPSWRSAPREHKAGAAART